MIDFKERFAEYNAATGQYAFSNVRNGLIVGLVRLIFLDSQNASYTHTKLYSSSLSEL